MYDSRVAASTRMKLRCRFGYRLRSRSEPKQVQRIDGDDAPSRRCRRQCHSRSCPHRVRAADHAEALASDQHDVGLCDHHSLRCRVDCSL